MVRIAFLGYGTVGRALYALLDRRRAALSRDYGIDFAVTGVARRRSGWRANAAGLDPEQPAGEIVDNVNQWLDRSAAEVVFEALPLDPVAGQPALDYLRAAIEHGAHVISANKGPVVHGYRLLTELAMARGVRYRFESAVMDGAPVFSLARACTPLAEVRSVRGIFTSTATVVLEAIESGQSFAEGIALAQRLGIAEADPSYDVDGWDSAMKLC
ncbi:MAG: homoserine dehydrogenase, partial [Gemmatimonadaceae bacterium]